MTNNRCDYAVFIGRFQPFHIGHAHVFHEALKKADKLIVLLGSSGGARTLRNPFLYAERQAMIRTSLPSAINDRVILEPLEDFIYNDVDWIAAVDDIVTHVIEKTTGNHASIAVVGHDKDETTYYLKLFPHWSYIEVVNLDGISATSIRKHYFTSDSTAEFSSDVLSEQTISYLRQFKKHDAFAKLIQEYQAVEEFKLTWLSHTYPVTFAAINALIRYGDSLLLIKRQQYPGKDLLALPGGFLESDETLFDGCLRTLSNETDLSISHEQFLRTLVKRDIFDYPKRSARGRIITCCYYFDFSECAFCAESKNANNSELTLQWIPIAQLERSKLFEDHYYIIQSILRSN